MRRWFRELDELLRGQKTLAADLAVGRLQLSLRLFVAVAAALGGAYGFFMGWFALLARGPDAYLQVVASAVKLPALFLLTLVVTFPSLYVFNALVGCRLSWVTTLRLLVGAIVVNLAVAASFGPILGFFTFSTDSYSFMVLLNVLLLGVAGAVGLAFLLQVLQRTARCQRERQFAAVNAEAFPPGLELASEAPIAGPAGPPATPAPHPDELGGSARAIFRIWVVIFGLVGAQMGWLLRPFIGSPNMPFTWFRPRSGNFFQAMAGVLESLVSP